MQRTDESAREAVRVLTRKRLVKRSLTAPDGAIAKPQRAIASTLRHFILLFSKKMRQQAVNVLQQFRCCVTWIC